jgi:UDP-N-acetylmuramate dehydrogenase
MIMNDQGDVEEIDAVMLNYAYRSSALKERIAVKAGFGPVVLCANFRLATGDAATIKATADQYLQHRRRTQPVEPSVGSTFKNPPGDYAGRLIEAAGLKGRQVGGAEVSTQHANFILNRGGAGAARAADVLALMQLVQQTVYDHFGVQLEPEVQLVGEW